MNDEEAQTKSEESEVNPQEEVNGDVSEQMIPKSRLDKVIEQREEALQELENVKEEIENLKSLKDEIAELKKSVNSNKDTSDAFTQEEEEALTRIEKGLKERGYIKKDELAEIRNIDARNAEISRLSGKYSKGSGFPVFKSDEVMVYAAKNGFGNNLEAAYRDMHWSAIEQVIAKRGSNPPPTVDSERPDGGERQKGTEITTSDVAEMDLDEYDKSGVFDKFRKSIFGK